MMSVSVYRSKPTAHQAPGGYWFLRIHNTALCQTVEVSITSAKAKELIAMSVPQLADGGGL